MTAPPVPPVPGTTPTPPAPDTPPAPPAPGTSPPPAPGGGGPPPAPEPKMVTVPETYELTLPKDATIAKPTVDRLATAARGAGLSNDMAQSVLAFVNQEVAAQIEAQTKAWSPGGEGYQKQVHDYEQAALADAEIGGSPEKLKANVEMSRRVLRAFFPESVVTFLENTGFGSNPDVIRGFAKLGKSFAEGTFTAPPAPSDASGKRPADRMYDHPTSKAEG